MPDFESGGARHLYSSSLLSKRLNSRLQSRQSDHANFPLSLTVHPIPHTGNMPQGSSVHFKGCDRFSRSREFRLISLNTPREGHPHDY
jgi:hypothetical protein